MNKRMALISGSLLLLSSTITLADDGDDAAMEQKRAEMQTRMQSMNSEERALYKELNGGRQGNGDGTGKMNRYGQGNSNGSGKMNRYGQGNSNGSGKMSRYGQGNSNGSEQGGGYGSGYGSRSGGGRGRGH